jgi:hypothetical protein
MGNSLIRNIPDSDSEPQNVCSPVQQSGNAW